MKKNQSLIKEMLLLPKDALFDMLKSSEQGHTSLEANIKLENEGYNKLSQGKRKNLIVGFVNSLVNPFNIILTIVIALTFITDVLLENKKDFLTIGILSAIIIISTLISFIQEERSSIASERLLDMVSNTTSVLRDGVFIEKPIDEIVSGDIIKLAAGDIIPADLRLLSAKDLFLSQATLTGESQPVEKFETLFSESTSNEADFENLCLMGTNVVSGSATGIVLRIGDKTYLGTMNASLRATHRINSFEVSIQEVSRLLMKLMFIMVPVIFGVNALLKQDLLQAFLFALTVAVGLTPEMLPVILSSGLARGAINMAKHETIVKSQSSISSFGEMNVLCTDKTGTLTQDEIILERYMSVNGDDDTRVLRHAYLNSSFQSGFKNLIDIAIINRAKSYGFNTYQNIYKIVDEIPFDFARRRMSVILEDDRGKRQLITKGAVEEIMQLCTYIDEDGSVKPLDAESRIKAMEVYQRYNHDGLRMIAVAQKNDIPRDHHFSVEDESELVLIGFIGFLDPPKESAKPTIKSLNNNGVDVVVITGDSLGVAKKVCSKVGIDTTITYLGDDIELMDDLQLQEAVKKSHLFAKISPVQKQRIVKAFQDNGNTVGFLGDGVNDALALKQADVGISVDTAVDIAKDSADIILLKKDLTVLEEGIIEGRKTIVNMIKYLEMAVSGNLGNMISVVVASIFLPFLPLLPVHILIQNLLSDVAQTGIPFDNCSEEDLILPRKLNAKKLTKFMILFGPLSSLFDIICFLVLYFVFDIKDESQQIVFHTFWFAFGAISQALIIFIIRADKPFSFKNKPSSILVFVNLLAIGLTLFLVLTRASIAIDLMPMDPIKIIWVFGIVGAYLVTTALFKKFFYLKLNNRL